MWCTHLETTDILEGSRVCLRCGVALQEPDIRRDLKTFYEMVRRDHGGGYRHSMACIETEWGWCCATDCTMRRKGIVTDP